MFAKTIIDSDAFLDMPISARLLYYDLGMRGDDDGFINNPKKIMRMMGASEDDLKLLALKKFIIPFESGIVVIKHWKIHNYIQKDRYTETKYKAEKSVLELDENKAYTVPNNGLDTPCIQNVYNMDTQVRLGKVRLDISSNEDICPNSSSDVPRKSKFTFEHESDSYKLALKLSEMMHINNPEAKKQTEEQYQSWARTFDLMERIDKRTPKKIYDVMFFAENDDFWRKNILSASALRDKYDKLKLTMEG